MKHPNREQWVPYVFGEASPDAAQSLGKHLAECAECRAQVDAWRRTLKRLDAWQVPSRRRGVSVAAPVLKWAIAAAIVLGVGFGLGRVVPASDAKTAARLEASLRTSLASQIQEQVRNGLATELQRHIIDVRQDSSNAVARLELRLAEARKVDVAQFAALLEEQQDVDQAVTEAVLAKLQDDHEKDYLTLRKDLETVALVADARLTDTQLKLSQLTSATKPLE